MTVADLFWIFIILSALQPVIRQRILDAMRLRKIAQIERTRNSRVILLVPHDVRSVGPRRSRRDARHRQGADLMARRGAESPHRALACHRTAIDETK